MKPEQRELSRRLREAREHLGYTQQEVADHLGLCRNSVVAMEAGRRRVSAAELTKLARLFQHPVASLLGEEEAQETHRMPEFRYPIGAVLVHSACLTPPVTRGAVRLLVLTRHANEYPGGTQFEYGCRPVGAGGAPLEAAVWFLEHELAPWEEYARSVAEAPVPFGDVVDVVRAMKSKE